MAKQNIYKLHDDSCLWLKQLKFVVLLQSISSHGTLTPKVQLLSDPGGRLGLPCIAENGEKLAVALVFRRSIGTCSPQQRNIRQTI